MKASYRLRLPLPAASYRLRPPLSPAALALIATIAACGGDVGGVACPLLAPGALATIPSGGALAVSAESTPPSPLSSIAGPGALVSHPLWLAAADEVEVSATIAAGGVMFAYGPRNPFGGYPHCSAVSQGASPKVRLTAAVDGEFLVVVGTLPGGGTTDYAIGARCTKGCERLDRCATLAEQGCADMRCDGEVVRGADGCATCACDPATLCGPDRHAGPNGSCVLPACSCEGVPSEPVCGADGRTWESPCAAACAGVPIAREQPCAIVCPATEECRTPCHGLRAIGDDGCPTCACRPAFAADPASCVACPIEYAPVCGSDGVTYPNRCRARCAGAKLLYAGACTGACRDAPAGCTLDCAFGLRPLAGGGNCLACACADVPASCDPAEGPVCATLPGPIGETTLGSGCLALALGVGDGAWGPCGARCDDERPCPASPAGTTCQAAGFLAGRCMIPEAACGCARIFEPVCGLDGATWENACLARCAGVAVTHGGACCEAAEPCDETPILDSRGCADGCGPAPAADCAANAAFAPACGADGVAVEGSACAAHARGEGAFVEQCP